MSRTPGSEIEEGLSPSAGRLDIGILVVEDDEDDLLLLREYLGQGRWSNSRLHVASTLGEGIDELSGHSVDLILLDLNLPDSAGLDTLAAILKQTDGDQTRSPVPVIVLTGLEDDDAGRQAVREGAQDFICKQSLTAAVLARAIEYGLERAANARALDASRRSFRNLVDVNLDAILVLDAADVVRYANPAATRLFLREENELVGQVCPVSLESTAQPETTIAVGEGEERIAQIRVAETVWEGEPSRLLTLRDITERVRLEEQYRHAQKMEAVGQLAGGIAHDFNNVLMVILGFSQVVLDELPEDSEQRKNITEVLLACEHARGLVRQLLAFSRRQVLNIKAFDPNAAILEVDALLRRTLSGHVELSVTTAEGIGSVRADPDMLKQAIANLVINARDAMPAGGRITIGTEGVELTADDVLFRTGLQPGPHILISVRDTGHGIPEDIRARVFDPFFTTKERGKGSGLGLAMVYSAVVRLGGHVEVESEEGVGTEVKILLPLQTTAPVSGSATETEEESEEAVSPGTETILLAEDDHGVRRLTQRLLTKQGYTVLEAQDGTEAMRVAEENDYAFDLLLTDVVMPHMGGPELARRLAKRKSGLRVLFMSGFTDGLVPPEDLEHRHVSFLPKPADPGDLERAIRELLDNDVC